MTVALEGHEAVSGREGEYGTMKDSWQAIGDRAELLFRDDDSPGERAVKVLISMKLERLKNSPGNRDHYRDLCGYFVVLWETSAWRREGNNGRTQACNCSDDYCPGCDRWKAPAGFSQHPDLSQTLTGDLP